MKMSHSPGRFWSAAVVAMFLAVEVMAQEIGRVIALEGQAQAVSTDGAKRQLALKSPVHRGDTVTTSPASKLQISFLDDSIISMGEKGLMVMDQYVYSDDDAKKENVNCVVSAAKGVFRVVTGQITKLNPERFTVRTRLATIGIRGCDMGLRLGEWEERFYVLTLPVDHSVLVSWFKPGEISPMVEVLTSGMFASLRDGGLWESHELGSRDWQKLVIDSSPGTAAQEEAPDTDDSRQDFSQDSSDQPASAADVSQQVSAAMQTESMAQLTQEPASSPETVPSYPSLPDSGPSDPPYVPPPDEPLLVRVGGNPDMDDWDWGLWEDGSVMYEPNATTGGEFIDPGDFATIAADMGQQYDLTGFGDAAAVLQDTANGETAVVQGSATISILVGQAVDPVWGGVFSMSDGAGNSLDFDVDRDAAGGVINSDGTLSLDALNSYTMTVNGNTFDDTSLSAQSVDGCLVVPGAGASPISGATGEFHFEHGTDARADGAFGATFPPP